MATSSALASASALVFVVVVVATSALRRRGSKKFRDPAPALIVLTGNAEVTADALTLVGGGIRAGERSRLGMGRAHIETHPQDGQPIVPPDLEWLRADVYEDRTLRLADVPMVENVIEGKTFRRCIVLGPAIVFPVGPNRLERCEFSGSRENVLWLVLPPRHAVVGPIGLRECRFLDCEFRDVGLAGPPAVIEAVSKALRDPM